MNKFDQLYKIHEEWSNNAFGLPCERGPQGPLKHLLLEVQEALDAPDDLEEYADCLILVLDAARRAGFSKDELIEASILKVRKNEKRQWPKTGSDEPVLHEKSQ